MMTREIIHSALIKIFPYTLAVHLFMLFVLVIYLAVQDWKKLLDQKKIIFSLCLIAALGVASAFFFSSERHRLFFDEDIYIQIGHSIAKDFRSGMLDCAIPADEGRSWTGLRYSLNKEPNGFPFLISIVSRIFGVSDNSGTITNLLFFALGTIGLGFLAKETGLFNSNTFILAPLIFALWPENLRWAACSAAEISAVSLAIWSLAFAFRSSRKNDRILMWLGLLTATYSAQIRPEGILIFLPFFFAAFSSAQFRNLKEIKIVAVIVIAAAILLFPHLLLLSTFSNESWGASEAKFSFAYLQRNLAQNLGWWFGNEKIGNTFSAPAGISILAVLGALISIFSKIRKKNYLELLRRDASLILWGILFFGIFIPFYAGSYYYGTDVRFSLLPLPVVALFAAKGITEVVGFFLKLLKQEGILKNAILSVIIVFGFMANSLTLVPIKTEEARQAREEHSAIIILNRNLPGDAIVVSHTPSIWSNCGRASIQLVWALAHPFEMDALGKKYAIYYHWNYWDIAPPPFDRNFALGKDFLARYRDTETVSKAECEREWVFKLIKCNH